MLGRVQYVTAPLSGIVVEARQDGRVVASAAADAAGRFRLAGIAAGVYEIRPDVPPGYRTFAGHPDLYQWNVAEASESDVGVIRLLRDVRLTEPLDAASVGLPVALTWQPFEGATRYEVRLREDGQATSVVRETSATQITVSDLASGKTYRFSVLAFGPSAWLGVSETRRFTVR